MAAARGAGGAKNARTAGDEGFFHSLRQCSSNLGNNVNSEFDSKEGLAPCGHGYNVSAVKQQQGSQQGSVQQPFSSKLLGYVIGSSLIGLCPMMTGKLQRQRGRMGGRT